MSANEAVDAELALMLYDCAVSQSWAELDQGPYHRDAQPEVRDLVEDRDGAMLQLGLRLTQARNRPLTAAIVEIWQCNALGRYSGFPPPDSSRTDDAGMVEFRTIYPGWYPGRTVRIHVMIHIDGRVLTSQLYFPDEISDDVLARAPYDARPDRDTTIATDEIFPSGGDPAVLEVVSMGDGYRAGICLALPNQEVA
jgi:protocatechuate 3,4-dioxygenase beta subunit